MILIAPTSYKGTIGARAAADAMAAGARSAGVADIDVCPVSDGGPGLIEALLRPSARLEHVFVSGPLGSPVRARILVDGDTALVESADTCGLHLLSAPAPLRATTRGVGELLLEAGKRASEVVVGLGGSGTVDGGAGAAAALGWRFRNEAGVALAPVPARLTEIARIEPGDLSLPRVVALADVETRLCGARGAARTFGPQKGATAADIEVLDAGLLHLAGILARDAGRHILDLPGGGAAGGLGAGLCAFADARVLPGSQWVFERLRIRERIERADVVITGEGSYDAQSGLGKITGALIAAARASRKPVLVVAGRVTTAVPAGVHVVAADGLLTTGDLAAIVERELARLLPR